MKILKSKDETCQRRELDGVITLTIMFTPEVILIKM